MNQLDHLVDVVGCFHCQVKTAQMSYLIEIRNVCDNHLSGVIGQCSQDFPSDIRSSHLRMLRKSFVRERWDADLSTFDMIIESVEEVRDMRELALLSNSHRGDPVRLELKGQA